MERRFLIGNGMSRLILLICLCVVLFNSTGTLASVQFEVGRYWEYEHRGPRPGAMEPNAIDGKRIVQVVAQSDQAGDSVWVIEDRFTGDPNVIGRLHVAETGLLRALEVANAQGKTVRLTYTPAIAYQAPDMEIGAQKTVETKLVSADGKLSVPTTQKIKRLANDTVVCAAGRFEACRRYLVVTNSVLNLKVAKIPVKETRERWYSNEVNGLVKEVYKKEAGKFLMWSWEGYTATSTLASVGVEAVESNTPAATESTTVNSSTGQTRAPGKFMTYLKRMIIGAVLLIGICMTVRVLGPCTK